MKNSFAKLCSFVKDWFSSLNCIPPIFHATAGINRPDVGIHIFFSPVPDSLVLEFQHSIQRSFKLFFFCEIFGQTSEITLSNKRMTSRTLLYGLCQSYTTALKGQELLEKAPPRNAWVLCLTPSQPTYKPLLSDNNRQLTGNVKSKNISQPRFTNKGSY